MNNEYILCSAIWYKSLETPIYNCVNITEGIVLCGQRHPHIIHQMFALRKLRTTGEGENSTGPFVQGFLTNTNRFVDREEAAKIAFNANQISEEKKTLYSEDLY